MILVQTSRGKNIEIYESNTNRTVMCLDQTWSRLIETLENINNLLHILRSSSASEKEVAAVEQAENPFKKLKLFLVQASQRSRHVLNTLLDTTYIYKYQTNLCTLWIKLNHFFRFDTYHLFLRITQMTIIIIEAIRVCDRCVKKHHKKSIPGT